MGLNFVALHELFGKQYETLHAAVDELAERIRAISHPAPIGLGKGAAEDMIASLIGPHEKLVAELVKSIEIADEIVMMT